VDLSKLNEAQKQAVTAPPKPLAIIAGPGSGKTRVLTYRALFAVKEWHLPPERILAITFTNKAADELKERLGRLIPEGDRIFAATMHSFAARMLRYFAPYAGISQNFVIYDDDDSKGLIEDILKQMNMDTKKFRPMTYSITFPLRRQGCLTATRFLNSSGSVTVLGATTSKWYTRYS